MRTRDCSRLASGGWYLEGTCRKAGLQVFLQWIGERYHTDREIKIIRRVTTATVLTRAVEAGSVAPRQPLGGRGGAGLARGDGEDGGWGGKHGGERQDAGSPMECAGGVKGISLDTR